MHLLCNLQYYYITVPKLSELHTHVTGVMITYCSLLISCISIHSSYIQVDIIIAHYFATNRNGIGKLPGEVAL